MSDENVLLKDDPLWYKDAIIYQTHVKAFKDSNNDGYGDFRGLMESLDYIQDLGVNTIWTLPFYPSPLRDDGYDIADYLNIHPTYGDMDDFDNYVKEAHRRGIRVITELVINHTSDQHPWFQAARQAPIGSHEREFYVWSDTDAKFPETRIIFTDTEPSNWSWDPVAKQYYWHRFFSHQPDLNHNNPEVVEAVIDVMRYWLDKGVDGVRLDAIPYLCVREGTNNENLPETHQVIKRMRQAVDAGYKNRLFLAEANMWPEEVSEYFGNEDECHMAYHFPVMPRMYMGLAMEDRHPIVEIMSQTPEIPESCQWAMFLRNHDELTLEMVTDRERDYMYKTYAYDPRMKVNVGIRRRLAPLLGNDLDKVKLMHGMLMSMPGSPIVYYGDEIGMGDNIYLGDRNGVRTPMQWSPDRNAGFSRCDPQKLYLPCIMDPLYGYEAINVESQLRNPASLLHWMKRLIAVRKSSKIFGRGTQGFIKPGNRKILAYVREYQGEAILCVFNLARTTQPVELNLSQYKGLVPIEMMGRTEFPPIGELPYFLTLPGYGFYWFLLSREAAAPAWHDDRPILEEHPVLVLTDGFGTFKPEQVEQSRRSLAQKALRQFETQVLPVYMPQQRWFAAKGERIERIALEKCDQWKSDTGNWLFAWSKAQFAGIEPQTYFLPLSIAWETMDNEDQMRALLPATLAKVRQQARVGTLYDAFSDQNFCHSLVEAIGANQELPFADGALKFAATAAFRELAGDDIRGMSIRYSTAGSSNTGMILGERLFMKGYRRLQNGINAEIEMGRFLTEVSPFSNIVPVAGYLEHVSGDGVPTALVMLQGFVTNQGDAWTYSVDYLKRALEERLMHLSDDADLPAEEFHAVNLMLMRILGRRTGELHVALAKQTGDPAFDPEPISQDDLDGWDRQIRQEAEQTLDKLERIRDQLPEDLQAKADRLLAARGQVLSRIAVLEPAELKAVKTRYHGDYHLGQVLVAENDFVIIDFEGEPARPLEERRRKHSALKDVAGMLRSFNYAAYATLFRIAEEHSVDYDRLESLAREWERLAAGAFLAGYEEVVEGCPVYPAEPTYARSLIDLFTLEKAFYELRYELDNRPNWVGVPLGGLLGWLAEE